MATSAATSFINTGIVGSFHVAVKLGLNVNFVSNVIQCVQGVRCLSLYQLSRQTHIGYEVIIMGTCMRTLWKVYSVHTHSRSFTAGCNQSF